MVVEWYRNETWDDTVERLFEEKLLRAKRKEQYLRVQACILARSHPEVALKLLGRYFLLPDNFDRAQAHVDRATAMLALGRTKDAIASYEAALVREREFPQVRTGAYLELPYVIATLGIREQYNQAIALLEANEERLSFPVERFRWHAAQALIASDSCMPSFARTHAEQALRAADFTYSGLRYHASLGLVTQEFEGVINRLEVLCTLL